MITAIARAQQGSASRQQLLAAGIDRRAIDRRIRSGALIRKHPAVYQLGYANLAKFADETAALLACGPMAMLAGHSATTLWTLRPGTARPIHILVPDEHFGTRGLDGVIVHRSRILEPRDIRTHRDLPVTSPARTVLDVAATLPDRDLGYIVNEGLTRGLLTEADIYEILRRAGRHPGRHTLTNLMANWTGTLTESQAQRQLLELIREAGLPLPESEVPLLEYRVDMLWRDLNLVVEVDGYGAHGTRSAFERDRRRDARLKTAGFTVIRFTAREIEHDPLAVIAQLAQTINALDPGLV